MRSDENEKGSLKRDDRTGMKREELLLRKGLAAPVKHSLCSALYCRQEAFKIGNVRPCLSGYYLYDESECCYMVQVSQNQPFFSDE